MTDPVCSDAGAFFRNANDVTRVIDYALAALPGVTPDMVSLMVWATIEDFYIRSAYRREHVYWQLDPGEARLEFDPYDNDWRVCRFMGFNGLSRPKFVPPGLVLDLTDPVPDTTRSGEALLALKPESIQTELPYDIWTTYWETLYNGCMSRLYLQPGKPYTDVMAGNAYGKFYRTGIASARADAQAGHLRETQSWSYPYFAGGGHSRG